MAQKNDFVLVATANNSFAQCFTNDVELIKK